LDNQDHVDNLVASLSTQRRPERYQTTLNTIAVLKKFGCDFKSTIFAYNKVLPCVSAVAAKEPAGWNAASRLCMYTSDNNAVHVCSLAQLALGAAKRACTK
jgi:hypothetical protein